MRSRQRPPLLKERHQPHASTQSSQDASRRNVPNRPVKPSEELVTSRLADLRTQGMRSTEIAAQVGMAERTVREWLSRGQIPYSSPAGTSAFHPPGQALSPGALAPGLSPWITTGKRTEEQKDTKGHHERSIATWRRWNHLASLSRKYGPPSVTRQTASSIQSLTHSSTSEHNRPPGSFFRKQEDLKEEEQERLRLLRQASPPSPDDYQLVEKFLHMVRERTGEQT